MAAGLVCPKNGSARPRAVSCPLLREMESWSKKSNGAPIKRLLWNEAYGVQEASFIQGTLGRAGLFLSERTGLTRFLCIKTYEDMAL